MSGFGSTNRITGDYPSNCSSSRSHSAGSWSRGIRCLQASACTATGVSFSCLQFIVLIWPAAPATVHPTHFNSVETNCLMCDYKQTHPLLLFSSNRNSTPNKPEKHRRATYQKPFGKIILRFLHFRIVFLPECRKMNDFYFRTILLKKES